MRYALVIVAIVIVVLVETRVTIEIGAIFILLYSYLLDSEQIFNMLVKSVNALISHLWRSYCEGWGFFSKVQANNRGLAPSLSS